MGENINTVSTGQRTKRKSARIENQNRPEKPKLNRSGMNNALRRAHEYTNDNYDYEASRTMAGFFKYDDLKKSYNALIKEYEKRDGTTLTMDKKQKKLDEELFKRIARDYGDDVRDEVVRRM